MTSPWFGGLDLLADDDLHAVLGRLGLRVERARRSRCGRSPRSRRGPGRGRWRAAPRPAWRSRGCGRCACAGRRRCCGGPQPRGDLRVALGGVAPGGQLGVEASSSSATALHGRGGRGGVQPLTQRRGRRAGAELRGERVDVAGSNSRPGLAVAQDVLVDRQPRRDGHGARGLRAQQQRRGGRGAVAGGDDDVGARPAPRPRCRPSARAPAGRRAAACSTTARARSARRPPTAARRRGGAARAGTGAARRAPRPRRSRSRPGRLRGVARRACRRPGRRRGSRRGRSAPAARPSPRRRRCARRGGRRRAGRPCARPAWPATRSVGAWKVPTFSAREWRSAAEATLGANGSWTCTRSSGGALEQLVDRARDVDRQRGAPAPGSGGSTSPTASTRGSPPGGSAAPARIAWREARTRSLRRRRRDDQQPVPAGGELLGDAADEDVDLVLVLPRVGRDLGDREGVGHRAQDTSCARWRSRVRREDGRLGARRAPCAPAPCGPSASCRRLALVLGDELLGLLARLVVGALVVRRLHEVRARAVELAGDAVVERELAAGARRR